MKKTDPCRWLVFVLMLAVCPARAQPGESAIVEGWHVVRPGETLWSLAARYLGSEEEWPVLHALNPQIADPHWISPGDRVRVRVAGDTSLEVAQITKVSRRVEEQLTPHPWVPSTEEDLLNPRDGIRTFEASSSELLFPDSTRLVMSEDTLVFLGHGGRVEREVRRDEIEIVIGQADYGADADAQSRQLILGGSRVKPTASAGESSKARVRKPETGAVAVMIFVGRGAVESGGARQIVEAGMGTHIEDGEPPAPPEALLPAAEILSPEPDSQWYVADPPFSWNAVTGARSYVLEICRDPECGRLEHRLTGLDVTQASARLEVGLHYWRVTAVSESGLDGFPSAPAAFTIVTASADGEAPEIAVRVIGPSFEDRGRTYLGDGARLAFDVEDNESGVDSWAVLLDGAEVEPGLAQEAWEVGAHELVVVARDRAGNEGRSAPLRFAYDPEPPRILLSLERGRLFHHFRGEQAPVGRPASRAGRTRANLGWSLDGKSWQPVADLEWRPQGRGLSLRSRGRKTRIYIDENVSLPIRRARGIRILSLDQLSGLDELVLRIEKESAREPRLVVEAVDRLGNRSSVSWPLARGRRARRR